jgi:predicted nucleic acid-binding protein
VTLFLDANVIFAAAATPSGRVQAVLRFAKAGVCTLVSSRYAVEEARRNIAVKFSEAVSRLEKHPRLVQLVNEADPMIKVEALEYLPGKDAPILAAAVTAKADLLVTGDQRHFGKLFGKTLHGVTVVTPAEALRRVLEDT